MKRKILIVFSAILLVALLGTGTYAYFSKEDTAKNVITAGGVDFELIEKTDGGKAFPAEGVDIMPGDVVTKVVTAKNTGSHPMYIRIKLIKGIDDDKLDAQNCITVDINTTDWTEKEGYFYYNKVLEPGQETSPLFTEVKVSGEMIGNEYLGKIFTLNVQGFGVQSENNGTDVFSAKGWPIEIKK